MVTNTRHWESQPCFSVNNDYLYFVSNRPGGFGKSDIWRAKIVGNKFFDIENLGSSINTEKHEMSPFLHPDDLTLYFASNGHIGLGDYDLFVSRRDSIKNEWSFPLNLGYPINTYKMENSLIVSVMVKLHFIVQINLVMERRIFLLLPYQKILKLKKYHPLKLI